MYKQRRRCGDPQAVTWRWSERSEAGVVTGVVASDDAPGGSGNGPGGRADGCFGGVDGGGDRADSGGGALLVIEYRHPELAELPELPPIYRQNRRICLSRLSAKPALK